MSNDTYQPNALELETELKIAWLSNPNTRTSSEDVPTFLLKMHTSVRSLVGGSQTSETLVEQSREYVGAVTARKSLPTQITSLA